VQDVFPFFIRRPDAKPLDIPSFIQIAKQKGGSSAWKDLFKAYWHMTKTWHSSTDELIILAGLPSTGKSVVLEHLRHKLFPVQPVDLSAKREWHCIGPGTAFRFMRLANAKTNWEVRKLCLKIPPFAASSFFWLHRAKAVCQSMLHPVDARL